MHDQQVVSVQERILCSLRWETRSAVPAICLFCKAGGMTAVHRWRAHFAARDNIYHEATAVQSCGTFDNVSTLVRRAESQKQHQ